MINNDWMREFDRSEQNILIKRIVNDPEHDQRLADGRCRPCYYRHSMSIQVLTTSDCVECGTTMEFSTGDVNTLCAACAGTVRCHKCGKPIENVEE